MTPNCPTCAIPMAEGFIPDHGFGASRLVGAWVEGAPEFSFLGNAKVGDRPQYVLQAFRCPECGLVQLYAPKRTYG